MRCLVSLLLLLSFLCALAQAPVRAADEQGEDKNPYDYLTEEEKTYVDSIGAAYLSALMALDAVPGVSELSASTFAYDDATLSIAWMDEVKAASAACTSAAAALRRAPPASMAEAAEGVNLIADVLEGAFSACMPLLKGEARRGLAGVLGNDTSDFPFGFGPMKAYRPSELAKAVACVQQERDELITIVEGGQEVMLEVTADVGNKRIEEEEAEEALMDFLFDDCFIATAAYGTPSAREIDVLRTFRDEVLLASPAGSDLVSFYYAASPPIAEYIARHEVLRTMVREGVVDPIVRLVSWVEPLRQCD